MAKLTLPKTDFSRYVVLGDLNSGAIVAGWLEARFGYMPGARLYYLLPNSNVPKSIREENVVRIDYPKWAKVAPAREIAERLGIDENVELSEHLIVADTYAAGQPQQEGLHVLILGGRQMFSDDRGKLLHPGPFARYCEDVLDSLFLYAKAHEGEFEKSIVEAVKKGAEMLFGDENGDIKDANSYGRFVAQVVKADRLIHEQREKNHEMLVAFEDENPDAILESPSGMKSLMLLGNYDPRILSAAHVAGYDVVMQARPGRQEFLNVRVAAITDSPHRDLREFMRLARKQHPQGWVMQSPRNADLVNREYTGSYEDLETLWHEYADNHGATQQQAKQKVVAKAVVVEEDEDEDERMEDEPIHRKDQKRRRPKGGDRNMMF